MSEPGNAHMADDGDLLEELGVALSEARNGSTETLESMRAMACNDVSRLSATLKELGFKRVGHRARLTTLLAAQAKEDKKTQRDHQTTQHNERTKWERVLEIRAEAFAEDVEAPPHLSTWEEKDVRRYFETGGLEREPITGL